MKQQDFLSTSDATHLHRNKGAVFLQSHFGWMLSLFLIGLGAKLWLIFRCGSPLPYADQWDGEAKSLYIPFFHGQFGFNTLFRAHNEHRIFFTRIYDLALLLINRQWDNQLQMVANAIFHSAILAGFGGFAAHLIGKFIWPFIWPPLLLSLVLPFAWENTLCGFQSQFYFLLLFSLMTVWLLGLSPPWSSKWWLGAFFAIATLFTTASGFLAADAVLAMVLMNILKGREPWRPALPTLAICGIITVTGFLLKKDIPAHHILMAHSFSEFLISLGNNLAWPWIVLPFYAPFNFLPLILLGWVYLKSNNQELRGERFLLGVGFWVCAQAAAAGYGRGAGGSMPYWRYMDSSSFTMIANCAAIGLLVIRYRAQLRPAWFWSSGFIVWGVVCLTGLSLITARAWRIDIPERELYQRTQLKMVRGFLATGNMDYLLNKPRPVVLLLDPLAGADVLLDPYIRSVLPACVRPPLKVTLTNEDAFSSPAGDCIPASKNFPPEPAWGFCPAAGSTAPRTLQSLPVQQSSLPFLEIPVAGDLRDAGLSLALVDSSNGRTNQVIFQGGAGVKWSNAYARAPAHDFKIVASDDTRTGLFAFRQPRELGRLSYWAIKILRAWKIFLGAGAACFVFNLMWLSFHRAFCR